jgi:hypothetical protein
MQQCPAQVVVNPLTGAAQLLAQLGQGVRSLTIQAVVTAHDPTPFGWELYHQAVKGNLDFLLQKSSQRVESWGRLWSYRGAFSLWHCFVLNSSAEPLGPQHRTLDWVSAGQRLAQVLSKSDSPPYLTCYGDAGVGGEGKAALHVEGQNGMPEADASFLEHLGVGQRTVPLPTNDVMNQAIVLAHQLVQAQPISGLGLTK